MCSKSDAKECVYKYLMSVNRPYSANDIMLNLHNEFGKTAVQKALDDLTREAKIREKVYGKQKIYCIIQDDGNENESGAMETELKQLDFVIEELTEKVKTAESELKVADNELKEFEKQPSLEECILEKKGLMDDIKQLTVKIENLSPMDASISDEEKKRISEENELYLREYRKRKRICMDILNSILENCPKSKKVLIEEIGIETDEEAGFQILS